MSDSFTQLLSHIVFSTKYRQNLIEAPVQAELYPFMGKTVRRHGGYLLAIGGMPDHVHLLVQLRPNVAVATMVRAIKTNSSRWLRIRPDLGSNFSWQTGYAAFSVSRSRTTAVLRYIQNQEAHHTRVSSEEELQWLTEIHDLALPDPFSHAPEGHR